MSKRRLTLGSRFAFGRDMHLIALTLVLANIGTNVEQRFFPLYVRELGASPTEIGLVATVAGFFIIALSPLGGWATDRYRRVALYALGPIIGAVGELLMVFAPRWQWLIPGYLLASTPGLLVGPALFGLVSDIGSEEKRASRFAYQAAAFGVCATVGPLMGGYIYQYFGYRTFLVGQAAALLVAGLLRTRVRDPRETARRESGYQAPGFWAGLKGALKLMLSSRQIVFLFAVSALVGFGMAAAGNFFSIFMDEVAHVDEAEMGVVYALAGVASIAASVISGVAADRFGKKPVVSVAVFGMGLGLIWFSGARALASLGAVWIFQGFATNLSGPALNAFFADLTDKDSRGTVNSLFNGLQNAALLPGPLIGGYLWDRVAPVAPFWFAAALAVAGGVILAVWMKEPGRKNRPQV